MDKAIEDVCKYGTCNYCGRISNADVCNEICYNCGAILQDDGICGNCADCSD